MGLQHNDYANWSEPELRKAESAADDFLNENMDGIIDHLQATISQLGQLVDSVGRQITLDERLNAFARIAEAARVLEEDARGFFSLASEPVVARLLARAQGPSL
jgi:hypothetical protein